MADWQNQLYFGDNLGILQIGAIPVGSVDLVYLDPPQLPTAWLSPVFSLSLGPSCRAKICKS